MPSPPHPRAQARPAPARGRPGPTGRRETDRSPRRSAGATPWNCDAPVPHSPALSLPDRRPPTPSAPPGTRVPHFASRPPAGSASLDPGGSPPGRPPAPAAPSVSRSRGRPPPSRWAPESSAADSRRPTGPAARRRRLCASDKSYRVSSRRWSETGEQPPWHIGHELHASAFDFVAHHPGLSVAPEPCVRDPPRPRGRT